MGRGRPAAEAVIRGRVLAGESSSGGAGEETGGGGGGAMERLQEHRF
ncbi:MAG: hypothetical protein WBK88_02095 [Methanothrix sp.]